MSNFKLCSPYTPSGDQPNAIKSLVESLNNGDPYSTLLGVTGSGKTFTMASVIAELNRPALIFAPNKTLAAQLYVEFKQYFPENAVEYFVSYYDYYQPEAYVPHRDLFIEKDAKINEELEKFRLSATRNLYERRDTIVVASVSCIYGLGNPTAYLNLAIKLEIGSRIDRSILLRDLVAIQYLRNDIAFDRGMFRVRGDMIDIHSAYEDVAYRIHLFDNEIEKLSLIDPLTGKILENRTQITIWPKTHYVTPDQTLKSAINEISLELENQENNFKRLGKIVEAQRLHQRVSYDIEMMREMGYCSGIENYSRFLDSRKAGQPPNTLLDYFPDDFLLFMDESHVAIGQLNGMYNGDRSRKQTLVDYGFRLPSALDNRPLKFSEFEKKVKQIIFVSATPGPYELDKSEGVVVEQVVRPTGLVDPEIIVRPLGNQVDDLIDTIRSVTKENHRVLVTVLTKKLAEQLASYCSELGIRAEYMHSEIDTLQRVELLKNLRKGVFDVLIGINLLREGLDLPEVALVAILDADKEGYLRSKSSLIQTIGRAARNIKGKVILYADRTTESMKYAINETNRRRAKQLQHNKENNITPQSIIKRIDDVMGSAFSDEFVSPMIKSLDQPIDPVVFAKDDEYREMVFSLESQMKQLALEMKFEAAANVRDKIKRIEQQRLTFAPSIEPEDSPDAPSYP
ncbi:MAG: excinuclease ABC subunit UvrB [Holophagaceae bacterium]|jgi:excinuclease ABC subunit B